jgi:hypothetical protein
MNTVGLRDLEIEQGEEYSRFGNHETQRESKILKRMFHMWLIKYNIIFFLLLRKFFIINYALLIMN